VSDSISTDLMLFSLPSILTPTLADLPVKLKGSAHFDFLVVSIVVRNLLFGYFNVLYQSLLSHSPGGVSRSANPMTVVLFDLRALI